MSLIFIETASAFYVILRLWDLILAGSFLSYQWTWYSTLFVQNCFSVTDAYLCRLQATD